MSKGSTRRLRMISREEEDLRYKLAYGEISLVDFTAEMYRLRKVKITVRKNGGIK